MLSCLVVPPVFQWLFVHFGIDSAWWGTAAKTGEPLILSLVETFGIALGIGLFCLYRAFGWGPVTWMLIASYVPVMGWILSGVSMGAAGGL
jgi:hypothetical protein